MNLSFTLECLIVHEEKKTIDLVSIPRVPLCWQRNDLSARIYRKNVFNIYEFDSVVNYKNEDLLVTLNSELITHFVHGDHFDHGDHSPQPVF